MKTDLTVSKKATINTGNYSSITPSISLTLKDVDVDKIPEVYEHLNTISGALFLKEFEELADTQEAVKTLGIRDYFSHLDKGQMENDVMDAMKALVDKNFEI